MAILNSRRVKGTQLIAQWSQAAIRTRSAQATRLLQMEMANRGGARPEAALMYGTNFFPERSHGIPVGAALDATFAQLARSRESWFGLLKSNETEYCIERQREILERCQWLFPRSEWCARSLMEDYGVPREKIVVTGAGPNFDEPPPERKGYDGRTLLFVGRDWARKNGALVVEAFRRARMKRSDIILKIVGPSVPPRGETKCVAGVEWIGSLDGERRGELLKLYSEASLLLFPSRFEPFGIAMLEAMAAGCPVIAKADFAAPEVIVEGRTGSLLSHDDPELLASKILYWLDHPEALARAGAEARRVVRESYNWDVAARRVISAFRGQVEREREHIVHPQPPPGAAHAAKNPGNQQPKFI